MTDQPQKISTMTKVISVATGLVLFGYIGWGLYQASQPHVAPWTGQIDAKNLAIAAKIPGRIREILVQEGQKVTARRLVATVATPRIDAKLAQAQAAQKAAQAKNALAIEGSRREEIQAAAADVRRARAASVYAQKSFARIQSLYQDGLVAQQKLDEVQAAYTNAQNTLRAAQAKLKAVTDGARPQEKEATRALVEQAQAAVREVESYHEEGTVLSPIDGRITRILLEPGEIAPAGFPIAMVTDIANPWLVLNVREDALTSIRVGSTLRGRIPALAQKATFTVYWINARGDYATWRATRQSTGYDLRTFEVRARPTQPIEGLRPGMTVVVDPAQFKTNEP